MTLGRQTPWRHEQPGASARPCILSLQKTGIWSWNPCCSRLQFRHFVGRTWWQIHCPQPSSRAAGPIAILLPQVRSGPYLNVDTAWDSFERCTHGPSLLIARTRCAHRGFDGWTNSPGRGRFRTAPTSRLGSFGRSRSKSGKTESEMSRGMSVPP